MRFIFCLCILTMTFIASASAADKKSVTFYSDHALVELEMQSNKENLTIPLPAQAIDGTLRITPLAGTTIQRVEIVPARQEGKHAKELKSLLEQQKRLQDRLQALSTREEIFKAAAKSQSGKAPRKTKANPDPIQSIRQGTDFALAQLERVYAAQRTTEHELLRIDQRIAVIQEKGADTGTLAKVTIHPKIGRVRAAYALAESAWSPRYDLRLDNSGMARLSLYGNLPQGFDDYTLRAAFGPLTTIPAAGSFITASGKSPKLAEYQLPASVELFENTLRPSFSYILTNTTPVHLPAGEATLYYSNEYRGQPSFDGISSGRSKRFTSGVE